LIFSIVRLPGEYGAASGFATTPSSPAPSNSASQRRARSTSSVARLTCSVALSLGERRVDEVAVAEREQVEGDELRGGLDRQRRDPRGGGVDPLAQRLPVEPFAPGLARAHDDLAVEHARTRQQLRESGHELGEVPRQRLRPAAADLDLESRTAVRAGLAPSRVDDAAESVPLRLVRQTARHRVGSGHLRDGLGEHGDDRVLGVVGHHPSVLRRAA
jgi:hypothetical protein